MLASIFRRVCFVLLAILFLTGSQCSSSSGTPTHGPGHKHPAPPATSAPPTQESAETWTSAPTCNGGNPVTAYPSSADQNMASQMVAAIRNWRLSQNLSGLNGHANSGAITVAYYHAEDMNGHSYVGLVASDGENVTQHLACTDPNQIMNGGAIMVGQSDSVTNVLNYITMPNTSEYNVLTLSGSNTSRLVVGYSNGYWCILIY
jgi:uncharacterized protein YkwD